MVRELKFGHRVILKAVLLPKPIGNSESGDGYAAPTSRWDENIARCKGFGTHMRTPDMSQA